MPLNIPGLLVPFQLLWNPRIALPHLVVAGNYLCLPRYDKPDQNAVVG